MGRSSSHHNWTGKPKVRHTSIEDAEAHLQSMIKKYPGEKNQWGIYTCWCKGWHIGHSKLSHNDRTDPVLERLVGRLIGALRGTAPYEHVKLKEPNKE